MSPTTSIDHREIVASAATIEAGEPRIPRPRQLDLFPRSRPLSTRFGLDFFLTIPRAPGVYFMYDASDKLLYIGQSCDLRDRLNSYRHVHPDRDARRTWRLVHLVHRIEWRVTPTTEAAIALERELLLTHRPSFNRASVWPSPNWFIDMTVDGASMELKIQRENNDATTELGNGWFELPTPNDSEAGPPNKTLRPQITPITQMNGDAGDAGPCLHLCQSGLSVGNLPAPFLISGPRRFGPFNSGLRYLFPTLLRLLFLTLVKPTQFSNIPLKLLKSQNLNRHEFSLPDGDKTLVAGIARYLALENDDLVRHLENGVQAASPAMSAFEKTYWAAELEILQNFFDARVPKYEKPRTE